MFNQRNLKQGCLILREEVSSRAKVKESAVTPWDIAEVIFRGVERRLQTKLLERKGRGKKENKVRGNELGEGQSDKAGTIAFTVWAVASS